MANELKFSVLLEAVDKLSDKLSSIGAGLGNLANRATESASAVAQLGESMASFGQRLSLNMALVSQGADTLHDFTESVSEPAIAMEHSMATMAATTGLAGDALAKIKDTAIEFANTHPGVTAEAWTEGFRRFYGVYQDVGKAISAEDVAGQLARFGIDGQASVNLLTASFRDYGVGARDAGDILARTIRQFGGVNSGQLTMMLGRLGGVAKATHTPLTDVAMLGGAADQMFAGGRGIQMFSTLLETLASSTDKSGLNLQNGLIPALIQLRGVLAPQTGIEQLETLKDMGLGSASSLLIKLLPSLDDYIAKQKSVAISSVTLGKMSQQAYANVADSITQLHQNVSNLEDAFYSPALGFVARELAAITGATRSASGAAAQHSSIMRGAAITMTGLGAAGYYGVQALSSVGAAAFFMGEGIKQFQEGGALAAAATKLWTIAQWGLDVAMDANPIGLLVIGAAALALAAYEIYEHWSGIAAFFGRMWGSIKGLFMGAFGWMETAGLNLMKHLAGGILAGLELPFKAIEKLAGGIRNYLPFSPAKLGPLRDLGRIRIAETIAESIRPSPVISAIARTAAAVAISAPMMLGGPALAASSARGAGAPIVHYAPIVNGAGLSEEQLLRVLEKHAYDLRRILSREDERVERTKLK